MKDKKENNNKYKTKKPNIENKNFAPESSLSQKKVIKYVKVNDEKQTGIKSIQ